MSLDCNNCYKFASPWVLAASQKTWGTCQYSYVSYIYIYIHKRTFDFTFSHFLPQVRTFRGHTNEKNFVGLTVNSEYIACGSETNEVFVYHKVLGKNIFSYYWTLYFLLRSKNWFVVWIGYFKTSCLAQVWFRCNKWNWRRCRILLH